MFDGLGSERTIRDGSQNSVGSITFDAFGNTAFSSGSSGSPYMFAATSGNRNDGDCGLVHVGARYYDPQVGRFITRDTVITEHPFLYCGADPVNCADPSGNTAITLGLSITCIAVGGFDLGIQITIGDGGIGIGGSGHIIGGPAYGISAGPQFGITTGDVATGSTNEGEAGGFIGLGGGAGASATVPIDDQNKWDPGAGTGVNGGVKTGPTLGGGAYIGMGGSGMIKLDFGYASINERRHWEF